MSELKQPTKPYKDVCGRWYTKSLFWETEEDAIGRRPVAAVFSLHQDKPGLINARRTFVELGDPTGYKWAQKYLGDWQHWKALEKAKWFQAALIIWREELAAKVQAEALDTVREISKREGDKQALPAARFLATRGWEKGATRGRPSKAEVTGELKRQAEAASIEDEDLKRIGLVK
jgi:hypothetical protein